MLCIPASFLSVRAVPIRQAHQNLLREPFGVVGFGKQFLPDFILMGGLLPHFSMDQPKPKDCDKNIERKHDKRPKRKIDFHVATIQHALNQFSIEPPLSFGYGDGQKREVSLWLNLTRQ